MPARIRTLETKQGKVHTDPRPQFFVSASEFRKWLRRNHAKESVLWIGFQKKKAGRLGISYPQALDEALCFGWIDGVRKSINQDTYTIRFSPRKPKSIWSAVNIKRVGELTRLGQMEPSGLNAFAQRLPENQDRYSYEKDARIFDDTCLAQFQASEKAWRFFQGQPPGYQRKATWWVMSVKKEETRLKRLAILIADSKQGRRVGPVTGKTRSSWIKSSHRICRANGPRSFCPEGNRSRDH
jgi:uncharacterized protein YdeI (YjbR/CyaY-like superfamily)